MTTSIQEMRWVLRAQVGDREALEELLRALQPPLRRYLAGLVGTSDADDLLQNVLIIVIRKIGHLEDRAVFRPWTFRIASREAFRHLRKRRLWVEQHDDDSQLEHLPGPEARPSGELLQQILAADVISPASRAVLRTVCKARPALQTVEAHMAEDPGHMLHRSLDAVDAYRKRMMIALVFLAVLLLVVFFYGAHTAGRDTVSSMLAHFFMLIIWVTGLTVLVMIQIPT